MTRRQLIVIFKDKKLFISTTFVLIGLFFCGFYLFKDKVNAKSDLIEVNAKLNNFYFHRYGIRNDHYRYYLYFDDYKNKFQIIADFRDFFDKDSFERIVQIGDTLRIFIPRNDFKNLKNQEKVKLFGVYGKGKTFLDWNESIDKYNSGWTLVYGLIFIIVSGLIFYYNSEKLRRIERIN